MALTKVSTDGVKDDAITKTKIPANQIEASELADNAVDTNAIADQAVALSKLPHGTSSNDGKFLRANNGADPTFETVTGTTINNNADNRLITGSGTANTLNGEANLTFDGSNLGINGDLVGSNNTTLYSSNGGSGVRAGIALSGSDQALKFYTVSGGSERMRIDSSGNVGIGTTSPVRHMHLNGSDSNTVQLHITNSTTGTTGSDGVSFALGSDESLIINQRESNHIALKTADTERMRIDSSGNVGIGNDNPDQKLKIQDSNDVAIHILKTGSQDTLIKNTGQTEICAASGGASGQRIAFKIGANTGSLSDIAKFTDSGLCFGSDTAAANALNDYESGTWTVNTPQGSPTQVYSASYVKIGDMVTVSAYITGPSTSNGNNFEINSLPFQTKGGSNYAIGACYTQVHTTDNVFVQVNPNGNSLYVYKRVGNNVSFANLSGYYVLFTVTYFTN